MTTPKVTAMDEALGLSVVCDRRIPPGMAIVTRVPLQHPWSGPEDGLAFAEQIRLMAAVNRDAEQGTTSTVVITSVDE